MSVWDLNSGIRRSVLLAVIQAAFYLAGALAIGVAEMPTVIKIAGCILLAASAWLAWRRWRTPGAQSVRELSWIGDQVTLVLANGQRLRGQWTHAAVWRWLVVLKFKATDIAWRDELVLLPDSLPAHDFRRLKVRLLARN
ncbi:MAG TPA: protein YgfX [Fluviicoccus sp.]|nr:protein YgfX [Fluviicoccus sp.]